MTLASLQQPRIGTALGTARARRATVPVSFSRHRPEKSRFLPFKLALLAVVTAFVAWTGLLPQQLGGAMSYVISDGISMLPHIRAGDLVIVRREPTYHVGEVAAFHNQQLHVIVLHRIVAIRGNHYVFKGDNNSFATSYEPTRAQIVGAEWAQLPGFGQIVLDLRTPIVAAALLGVLWLYSFWRRPTSRRRRRRHRNA